MNSDVMTHDSVRVQQTDAAYGSNRISYDLFVMGLCGGDQAWSVGTLQEQRHQQVNYDVTQQFPDDEFAQALKATQTEIAQVTGAPIVFNYNQQPYGVEFILSKMTGVNAVNISAGIIKNLLKKFDYGVYIGVDGNFGLKNNPNAVSTAAALTSYAEFKAAVDAAIVRLKAATDFSSSNYSDVNLSYSGDIVTFLGETDINNTSNRQKLLSAYPNLVLEELPSNLEKSATLFHLSLRPMLTFHHASLPAEFAKEMGKYKLSEGTLYTYESAAVEIEVSGALQTVTAT